MTLTIFIFWFFILFQYKILLTDSLKMLKFLFAVRRTLSQCFVVYATFYITKYLNNTTTKLLVEH